MNLGTASGLMGANTEYLGPELFGKEIADFSIDSRTIRPGELFFALSPDEYARAGFNGTFADAHRFITDALGQGALAAVARSDRLRSDERLMKVRDRLLLVEDAIAALQLLARRVYEAWDRPVVAITGSAGKTTAKELTSQVLGSTGWRVLKSERNYNNGLGLPLSVLRMVSAERSAEQFDIAVLEMGMSSPFHEIARLCQITPPDIGVVLMVAPVHLEYLGSIENIAAAKAELIEGLKPGGTAVLNADDDLVIKMREKHKGRTITFGVERQADVTAVEIDTGSLGRILFRLKTPLGEAKAELPMSGRHNLLNALAAAAVATCFEARPEEIATGLRTAVPPRMRGEVLDFAAEFTVVDDSYNSNPCSLAGMVRTIAEGGGSKQRRIVVAGEMLELGPRAAELHREAGRQIARAGIQVLWGVRGLAREMVAGARDEGIEASRFFENAEYAAAAIVDEVRAGDLILIKGSRGVQTERVMNAVRARFPLLGADESLS